MKIDGLNYSWTQPICDNDFVALFGANNNPVRVGAPEPEKCCQCGVVTVSGLYVRINPLSVPYPSPNNE